MKHAIKTILLFFTAALLITGCSSDDPNPPTAGFTIDPNDVVQWDTSLVVDTSTGSDAVPTYTVTGGEFIYLGNTIQFLEAKTYTITQTVENEDGVNSTSQSVAVGTPLSKYTLDGADVPITTNAFWYLPSFPADATKYIRILVPISGQDNPNLIKILPVAGPNSLQGTYTYGADGDISTYDSGMTGNYAGFSFDWTTNGDGGDDLKIDLIYTDPLDDDNNVYDITLTLYTLNSGSWNWSTGEWISEGTKELQIYYRGKIDPID